MSTIQEVLQVPVCEGADVIVAGGGIAGVAAALAASREGVSVLLLEKQCQLGGLATSGLVNWYEPLDDGEGLQLVTGIADELMHLSIADGYGNLPEVWKTSKTAAQDAPRCATLFNPAVFPLTLNELMHKSGVRLMYDILACTPRMSGNNCTGVMTQSKSGRAFYPCKLLIDATGDADMLFRAGAPCRQGLNYMTYYGHGVSFASLRRTLDKKDYSLLNAGGLFYGSDLEGHGHPEGMKRFEGVTCEEVSEYIAIGQQGLLEKLRANPDVNLTSIPAMAQLRTTRCLAGDAVFTAKNGLRAEDSIGATGDFRETGLRYEIPVGALYNSDYTNLLAAGRTISATTDGWEVSRVIPTAAMTGQAAGTLAALAVKQGLCVKNIPVTMLQTSLENAGVTLHF